MTSSQGKHFASSDAPKSPIEYDPERRGRKAEGSKREGTRFKPSPTPRNEAAPDSKAEADDAEDRLFASADAGAASEDAMGPAEGPAAEADAPEAPARKSHAEKHGKSAEAGTAEKHKDKAATDAARPGSLEAAVSSEEAAAGTAPDAAPDATEVLESAGSANTAAIPAGSAAPADPAGSEKPGKQKKPKKPKKQRSTAAKVARGILIFLLVLILAVVIVAGVVVAYLHNAIKSGEEKVLEAGRPKAAVTQTDSDEEAEPAHIYTPTIDNTITYNGKTYAPNEKMVSVAFIGFDGGDSGGTVGQADAVMLFTLNLETGAVKVISVPRDSMVDVSEYVGSAFIGQSTMQLCLAYSYGDGAATSSEHVADLVSRVLYDAPVSYYFTLNYQGVGPLNDSIGGVTLTPLQTIGKTDDVIEGQPVTLWGNDALLYVRWRDESDTNSSLDRQARQMQYLSAFFAQVLEAAKTDPSVMVNLYNTAAQYSFTNLGIDEFSYLASKVVETGITSVDVVSLPGTMGLGEKYAEFYLDKEGVRQIVLDTFYHEVTSQASSDAQDAALSEQRGKADNESIATDDSAVQAASTDAAADGTPATDTAASADAAQPAQPLSAEDQAALDAANAAVADAAANW